MELSPFRQKLIQGDVDPVKRRALLDECAYFASIAPASLREKLHLNKDKIQGFMIKYKVPLIVGAIVLLPFLFALVALCMQLLVVFAIFYVVSRKNHGSPEYRDYDFRHRIAEPSLKLLDEKLDLSFHYSKADLVDEDMYYDDALVEAHLVRPLKRRCSTTVLSACSYDWENVYNTDAFEFSGYRIYYEYRDEDGDTHTEDFFNGLIFKFRTSFTVHGSINIMSTKTKKTLLGEKEKNRFKKIRDREVALIDTENQAFADNFDTIATYEEEAYRYLTPARIETLLFLRQKYYISLCIKGNVMTVTLYDGSYKDVGQSTFSDTKPYSRPTDCEVALDGRIDSQRRAILSIYDLKDLLDPDGRCAV